MIQADVVNNGGANVDALWTVFAQRGWASSRRLPTAATPRRSRTSPAARLLGGPVRDDLGHGHGQGIGRPARRRGSSSRATRAASPPISPDTTDGAAIRSTMCRSTLPSSSSTASDTSSGSAAWTSTGDESVDVKLVATGRPWRAARTSCRSPPPNYAPFCGVSGRRVRPVALQRLAERPRTAPPAATGRDRAAPSSSSRVGRRTSFGVASGGPAETLRTPA